MPITRTSSSALTRLGQSSWNAGMGLLGSNLDSMQRTKERRRAIFDKLFADFKRRKDTPSYDEGGGAKGAGIGAAIPLILAPFTAGASLAFLPAATAAGGAIGAAVDKPSGPKAAAASRQKQGAISMAAPFAAGGMSALGGQGFGEGYDAARGGLGPVGPDTSVWPDQEPGAIEPQQVGSTSIQEIPGQEERRFLARQRGNVWDPRSSMGMGSSMPQAGPTFQEIQAMTPAQRDAIDPRLNEVLRQLDMRFDSSTPLFGGTF